MKLSNYWIPKRFWLVKIQLSIFLIGIWIISACAGGVVTTNKIEVTHEVEVTRLVEVTRVILVTPTTIPATGTRYPFQQP